VGARARAREGREAAGRSAADVRGATAQIAALEAEAIASLNAFHPRRRFVPSPHSPRMRRIRSTGRRTQLAAPADSEV